MSLTTTQNPKKDERPMNQMNTTMNPFRITTIGGRPNFFAGNGQDTGSVGGQLGVDEMVYNSNNGTIVTIQDSPSLLSFINNRDGGCLVM